jgi:hypothetical protein
VSTYGTFDVLRQRSVASNAGTFEVLKQCSAISTSGIPEVLRQGSLEPASQPSRFEAVQFGFFFPIFRPFCDCCLSEIHMSVYMYNLYFVQ